MSSVWGAGDAQFGTQAYYESSDQYHDMSDNKYLPYLASGEAPYRTSPGSSFFLDAVSQPEPQGYWPNMASTTTNGLPSSPLDAPSLPLQDFTVNASVASQPRGGFASPSLLNVDTDPDSPWSASANVANEGTVNSLNRDTDPPHRNGSTTSTSRQNVRRTNTGGSKSSKKSSKDRQSKNTQSNTTQANGSSSRSKTRTGSLPSCSGGAEALVQLRTASRKAKRTSASYKPATSPEEERARSSHNQVEKQYRNRLNHQFERLLAILPTPNDDEMGIDGEDAARNADRRLSKVEVLDMARQHIQMLEKEASDLEQQRQELVTSIGRMTQSVRTGGMAYGSGATDM